VLIVQPHIYQIVSLCKIFPIHIFIANPICRSNTAKLGGGCYSDFSVGGELNDSTFTLNRANTGGGFYNKGSLLLLRNILFLNNSASSGGGITFVNNAKSEITENRLPLFQDIRLQGNHALLGGAIYVLPSRAETQIHSRTEKFINVSMISNSATYGGGLCVEEGVSAPFFGAPTEFVNNTALKMGGGAFINSVDDPLSWLYDAKFLNNAAIWAGSSVGWQALPNISNAFQFCKNCEFAPSISTGYDTTDGFATCE
jgi:hypothetical protein